ncbi:MULTISPECIES: TetR/AcrR family transcriptional regulator C-terminal domain-containing protein [Streptomyces]|uniref:TetR family transcriptional regulator n=1 Tax=Streptomyces hygroscopicus TaxID=1912 RepID=A0ABQ3TWA2_STRHY|nr:MULTISPECIES: TetR/AcrR family transcriptional regulator C-terminal domain-containing protein [Streptomyces]MBW8087633.1 TetR/AcrR family transcriptional regulator C-terminal domain-containing protein [Streptomyces hygroscopicus subsp. hygroscopicus]MDN3056763.1 TetR/AcrR family transcriptional regulator C-terminal domain-containing protein [Streptomyces sp. SRF1]GHJ27616.1 TetR family transcriptional regulator [Streptomyces hygroscopicus]
MATTRLDRTLVVDTALRLLNDVGLEGLTLRRIAKELNVQAPALYWHFKNKQALLDEMSTAMFRRMVASHADLDALTWQERLIEVQRGLRRTLLGYRDGAKVFSGSRFTGTDHARSQEGHLRAFVAAGFTPSAAARATFIAFSFTLGFVIEEQSVEPRPGERTSGYEVAEREARMAAEGYALAAAVSADLFQGYEERFEEGLRAVVAGIEATLAPEAAR